MLLTNMQESSIITRLDEASARKLSAGQVITDLSSVLKELIENSLDAGAHTVKVCVEDYGLGSITVEDDGCGMALSYLLDEEGGLKEDVFVPLLAARATTKCRQDADSLELETRSSLGFRGEALHSLAHLSEVTIHTMSVDTQPITLSLTYNAKTHQTRIQSTGGRKSLGTTVIVEKLFAALPVRHMEFNKSKKRQLLNATSLLKQYALSHPHIRLLVTHRVSPQSAPVTLVSLTGTGDTQRSLAEAYGGRYLATMTRVEWDLSFGIVTGYVSQLRNGRHSPDMQVLALDGRLVDLPAVSNAISNAYAECQPSAAQRVFPVFFLNISCSASVSYDVNLAPNKRKVLITEEERLSEEVHSEALQTFGSSTDSIEMERHTRVQEAQRVERLEAQRAKLVQTPVSATSMTQFTFRSVETQPVSASKAETPKCQLEMTRLSRSLYFSDSSHESAKDRASSLGNESDASDSDARPQLSVSSCEVNSVDTDFALALSRKREREVDVLDDVTSTSEDEENVRMVENGGRGATVLEEKDASALEFITDEKSQRRPAGVRVSMQFPSLEQLEQQEFIQSTDQWGPFRNETTCIEPFSTLAEQTEEELTLRLEKSCFTNMTIHGQFNHGFIIASLHDDVFVIDQHAADEKHNYECLLSRYVSKLQPLVCPVLLSVDPRSVDLAIEHSRELRKHGFIVKRSDDDDKLHVLSVPLLPYEVVKAEDVIELLQQLIDYGMIVKPMRCVWRSMATKACRTSIMIGRVLDEKEMTTIVNRLSGLDQPWNCPHGRPTIRHIAKISSLMATAEHEVNK
ncbi:Histidine kinase DNA gyrase B and HSP90 like ATPase DNA mismatch repair protein C terminal domain [Trypanosoma vivax]|uniref:Mismatch repair protein n=1 Tax=Trypanosoma vivax (strain Y486) TaxID=1055687 RepID=G0U3P3_TRYVY|nr:mismatch repair protein [Trypanosoma vivax]KAH8614095.1 Histidine kinase DNA gyrase B and HSP90 like ATPase DNA mismatch repair protein C terminal domain [Trypanosoma vivax]CCC50900.1 mismatch repair protein [Trypanosoma vivax Y486]